jgi:hypothetical protein
MAKEREEPGRGLGDEQGTKVGRPDSGAGRASEGQPTGAGSEAAGGPQEAPIDGHDREHRSGYGGKGGKSDKSSNQRP